jgi:hypothetical protein
VKPFPAEVPDRVKGQVAWTRARADRAWQMRVAGLSWVAIAERLGYANDSNVRNAVVRYYGQVPEPERVDLRRLWRDRLERLWLQCSRDVAEQRPGAVVAAVRVVQAAAALDGLNAPTVVETHVTESFSAVLVELQRDGLTAIPMEGTR